MSQEVNDLVVGAALLGAYSGFCTAIFNHKAGDTQFLRKCAQYVVGGTIALGGMMVLGTEVVAAPVAENPAVSVATPVLPRP